MSLEVTVDKISYYYIFVFFSLSKKVIKVQSCKNFFFVKLKLNIL